MQKSNKQSMQQVNLVAGDHGHYELQGVLSFGSVPGLLAKQPDLFHETDRVIIDLGKVEHSDSAGVALLVEWMNQASQLQKDLRFVNIPAQMLSIARVSGLDHIIPLGKAPV